MDRDNQGLRKKVAELIKLGEKRSKSGTAGQGLTTGGLIVPDILPCMHKLGSANMAGVLRGSSALE